MKEYEDRAVYLALNRPKLQDLTNRLKLSRLNCPLFDTSRWVSSFGAIYFLYTQISFLVDNDAILIQRRSYLIILMDSGICSRWCGFVGEKSGKVIL